MPGRLGMSAAPRGASATTCCSRTPPGRRRRYRRQLRAAQVGIKRLIGPPCHDVVGFSGVPRAVDPSVKAFAPGCSDSLKYSVGDLLKLRSRLLVVPRARDVPSVQASAPGIARAPHAAFPAPRLLQPRTPRETRTVVLPPTPTTSSACSSSVWNKLIREQDLARCAASRHVDADPGQVLSGDDPLFCELQRMSSASGRLPCRKLIAFLSAKLHATEDEAEDVLIEAYGDPAEGTLPRSLKLDTELLEMIRFTLEVNSPG